MPGPIHNPNIINPGGTEESLAASSSIISTGMEKLMNKNRAGIVLNEKKIDLKELEQYIQKLNNSTEIEKIKKRKEKREGKENRENPFSLRRKLFKRGKGGKKKKAFSWISHAQKKNILKAGSMDKFNKTTSIVDQNLVKEYAVKYARKIAGIPPELQEPIKARLEELKREFLSKGINEKALRKLRSKVEEAVLGELSLLIKKALFKNLSSIEELMDFILKTKGAKLFNLAFFNEVTATLNFDKEFKRAKEKISFEDEILLNALLKELKIDTLKTKDLVSEAEKLKVDLRSWMNLWNFEKIKINETGEILIDLALLEAEREKGLLLDELRMLTTQKLLDKSWKNRFFFNIRIRKVLQALHEYGVSKTEIKEAKFQAKRIAWAKTITTLKDLHLKRVFTSSKKEFQYYSKLIIRYTLKARKIGVGISHKGVKWIETKLKILALESAEYKLNLLKSMQSLSFEKKREKDIKWLTKTYEHLKEQVHLEETTSSIFHWVENLFGVKATSKI